MAGGDEQPPMIVASAFDIRKSRRSVPWKKMTIGNVLEPGPRDELRDDQIVPRTV